MDPNYKFPGSPGTPLFQISPDRVNQQRHEPDASSSIAAGVHSRDGSVHEKVAKFDSLTFQGKTLERKANDAALKRAMLGREEAESEMRRYREEVKTLKKQVEDGVARERKVGERLETVMENYGRAKETHAHTQALWEKEIRRARKESFRLQSAVVKLQEELKAVRSALRASETDFEHEKERSKKREQEAFAARYQLVGVQEELSNMVEKVKLVEQERDALKTIAKNEEIIRIAAEGQIPLPQSRNDDEEFASPRKASQPLLPIAIMSSASSEQEIEQLKLELAWERRRADKAHEHAQYMQLECQFGCCSCRLAENKGESFHYNIMSPVPIAAVKESEEVKDEDDQSETLYAAPPREVQKPLTAQDNGVLKPSTIFIPAEGVFRTVYPGSEEQPWISPEKATVMRSVVPFEPTADEPSQPTPRASVRSRTPSCEPPTTAIFHDVNTSLLSLIDGSHNSNSDSESTIIHNRSVQETTHSEASTHSPHNAPTFPTKPQTQTFHTISTTTRIPLAAPAPAHSTDRTFSTAAREDAISQTMSREEALAQIRERRGRARSLAQGTLTPMRVAPEKERDFSAPAARSGGVRR